MGGRDQPPLAHVTHTPTYSSFDLPRDRRDFKVWIYEAEKAIFFLGITQSGSKTGKLHGIAALCIEATQGLEVNIYLVSHPRVSLLL